MHYNPHYVQLTENLTLDINRIILAELSPPDYSRKYEHYRVYLDGHESCFTFNSDETQALKKLMPMLAEQCAQQEE